MSECKCFSCDRIKKVNILCKHLEKAGLQDQVPVVHQLHEDAVHAEFELEWIKSGMDFNFVDTKKVMDHFKIDIEDMREFVKKCRNNPEKS